MRRGSASKAQFAQQGRVVDASHPHLFIYRAALAAAGGVAFGLKRRLATTSTVSFAEPTHSPAMLLGVYTGLRAISVQDIDDIDNLTATDGFGGRSCFGALLVGQWSVCDGLLHVDDQT